MKLHGLARVKNEGDVIEEFVRHTLRYLDALTVIDNASFDGTPDVLEALVAEGLPLRVLHDAVLPKRQWETMTSAARQSVAQDDWDYLFLLDADEFLKVPDRAHLEASLGVLAPAENGLLPWFTYVPTALDPPDETPVLSRIRHRRVAEAEPAYSKCVISRGFAAGGDVTIGQGNHEVRGPDGVRREVMLPAVGYAHFAVRSLTQIQAKVLLGWGAYLAMGYDAPGFGWHQRRLFADLEAGATWTAADVSAIAQHYLDAPDAPAPELVYDPLPCVPVRYGNAALTTSIQAAARYIRQLAVAFAAQGDASALPPQSPPRSTDP